MGEGGAVVGALRVGFEGFSFELNFAVQFVFKIESQFKRD